MQIDVRKFVIYLEEIRHENGPPPPEPQRKAAIAAVIRNPFGGRGYVEEIAQVMDELKPLGLEMARRLIDVLGGDGSRIESYGKGAVVSGDGELEHAALWHVPGGYGMRELLGNSKAVVPSSKKVGAIGCRIDIPLSHVNATYVRSHFDAIEVGVPDAPRHGEMVVIQAMATGPRVHARVGGLRASEIKGEDGLR